MPQGLYHVVEPGRPTTANRIGNRPVQPVVRRFEFFMGFVTHRHDQRWAPSHVRQMFGGLVIEAESGSTGGSNGTGMNTISRVSSGRVGRSGPARPPQGSRQLTASGVTGAHEEHPTRTAVPSDDGKQRRQRVVDELYVTASSIARRRDPPHEIGPLEHPQMMGDQVGVEVQPLGDVARRQVGETEQVDDAQTRNVTQGGEGGGSFLHVHKQKNMPQ